jgi:Transposase DDE domain
MTACTRSAVAMLTDFFASDDIEAAARRTGFVKRESKITGKLFLALVTFGVWSEAKTTLAQLAAKVTQVEGHVAVSPEALHQRMNKRAMAFLQEMIQQALGKMQDLAHVCDDHLFDYFLKVHIADSTGFSLPENLKDSFPGSGGSATKAGAKIQLVWEYKQSLLEHFVLMPWKIPENKYVDTVVALARTGGLFLFDLGYFKIKALARIAGAGAYFLTRLNHQANLLVEVNGHLAPFDVVSFLKTSEEHLVEKQISIGAQDLVATRLIAARVPDHVVNKRRRAAKQRAKKKGYTPSKAHRELLAWNLFITNVPSTIWSPITVVKAYPIRWQIELIFKSWKSYCHLAAINAKKAETILCYLYGRMLLILINYALYPQVRCALWVQKHRELSVLKLLRHFQAFADTWIHVIFQGELALCRFLQQACASAERLAAKASRKRRTTAQTLRASLPQQLESVKVVAAVNA